VKILLAHNFYQSSAPSGEDVVFKNEVQLLKNNGIKVITYEKYNDDIKTLSDKFRAVFTVMWSNKTYNDLKNLIKKEKPDVVHFHNIWYLMSPSAYYACKDSGVPVVQTFHNFRLFCANGLCQRKGEQCFECLGKIPWKGVLYRCYKQSVLYSLPIAITECVHNCRKTWVNKIDAVVALTRNAKNVFIRHGIPEGKIFIKSNFLVSSPEPSENSDDYCLFLGRLSSEKGVLNLIDAFKILLSIIRVNISLKIIGDGPLRSVLEKTVKDHPITNIEILGKKSHAESMEILKKAKFVVIPSIWFEMFPMVLVEAFAHGKPVIASRVQNHSELIQDKKTGVLFNPADPEDLAVKMKWMIENEDARLEIGKNARKEFEEKYTAEKNFEILMNIYKKVIGKQTTNE
jgi:glycosyltransferase involved in cell wall biosynthesis